MNKWVLLSAALSSLAGISYLMYRTYTASTATTGAGENTVKSNQPRGVRNNNPLNIRDNGTSWQGMCTVNADPSFVEFQSPEYGFRAGARILRTYYRSGYKTLSQMISRWAPASENDTAIYIQNVSNWTGIAPGQVVDVYDKNTLSNVLLAMSRQECGQYYDIGTARDGVMLA
ncbi:hypothetical protein VA7868_02925 [Vibrio aerogenes CECT 7868]|uniref:Uncharacterized protein n=1 Tax=Vibrio aerogenes CECT 7868 TaxID=1216006 RepID=A0A1M5ZMB2_9VIBR|nr:virion protein [Vibrio aerogenes]SHI25292.1 hypothetical protein VA7868_02925 [Vibrio aerogenes CECT 7868]